MKTFVLLYWFYEDDGNLVNSYIDVLSTYERAYNLKSVIDNENLEILNSNEIHKMSNGNYGDPGFYEIRECEIK